LKISVITAVYNRVNTVGHAIKSLQSQTHRDVEHVIQDGKSMDGTIRVIEGLTNPAISLVSAADTGIYDAINRGISRSTGEIIGLLHSDDFFAHDRVLELVAEAFSDQCIDGVYGDLEYVASNGTMSVARYWRAGGYEQSRLRYGWMPPHPTLYLRREVFERWGLYDTNFRIASDYDAMLRYLVRGQIKLAYIPDVLVKMRVGGESNRSIGRVLLKSREDLQAIRRNGVGGLGTLACKNLSKLPQFFKRQ
jgi:glycosyltransferase involved in cell wall biosynthesis